MQIKAWIPNSMTLGNLFCGCLAIILSLKMLNAPGTEMVYAWDIAWLMIIAVILDFGDGMVARLLKVSSPLGKELDSLADMVTFGVLPGMLAYLMLAKWFQPLPGVEVTAGTQAWWLTWLPYMGLIIPLFSALRLAKFNLDTRQTDKFIGVPTPTNALFFLSLFLMFSAGGFEAWHGFSPFMEPLDYPYVMSPHFLWVHPYALPALIVVMSFLMISEFPLLALKFKSFRFEDNMLRYILILGGAILVAVFTYKSVPLIVIFYFMISLIDNISTK